MLLVLIIVGALTVAVYFLNSHYKYWEKKGVPGPKPSFLIGNLKDCFLLRKSLAQLYSDVYKEFENYRLVGIFRATTPTLIIRDPELIRDVTVKSFQSFHDNDLFLNKEVDPLSGRNPFFSKGAYWKSTRTHLTPSFTSGKMKLVYPLLEEVSKNFVRYLEKHPSAFSGKGCKIKDECMRFTLNNVGSCAFGLDAKCFEEENPEFKQIADRYFSPEGFHGVKLFLISVIPYLAKIMSIKYTPKDVEENLYRIVREILKLRQESKVVRNDFLHIMNEIASSEKDFNEVDVVAHAAGFLGDGYETSSIVMHFFLYELATHLEEQETLRDEIKNAFEDNNGTLPFDALHSLPYLDAAFYESLRLHPPLGSLNKVCTKEYTYEPTENDKIIKPFVIEPDTSIILPLYALHRDPKYFDAPDDFKPERFLKENRTFPKYSFLPFGEGPRACLGQRFGIMQVKIGVAYLINNFEFTLNRQTKLPISYDSMYFLTLPKHPIILDLKKL